LPRPDDQSADDQPDAKHDQKNGEDERANVTPEKPALIEKYFKEGSQDDELSLAER